MTPKLEKKYICVKCGERYHPSNNVNGIHSYFGLDCNGELIPHFSQSSLVELLRERIEHLKSASSKNPEGLNFIRDLIELELQSILSMIEKGE